MLPRSCENQLQGVDKIHYIRKESSPGRKFDIESQKEAIIMTLVGVAKTHNKPYCWITQNRQLELLSKYHSWNISRRTLNRRLEELENDGYIIRVRRHKKLDNGQIRFSCTLYKFTGKLFAWLFRIGRSIAHIFGFFRLPKMAQHKFFEQNKIYKGDCATVEILWKNGFPQKGRASPS